MPGTYGFLTPQQGTVAQLTPANPAAGAQYTVTVPAGEAWRITAVSVRYVASAVAANRILNVTAAVGANVRWCTANTSFTTATTTTQWTAGIRIPELASLGVGATLVQCRALPDVLTLAGTVVTLEAINIQVADQISNVVVTYQSWRV